MILKKIHFMKREKPILRMILNISHCPMNSSQKLIHSVYLFISIFILPQLLVAMGSNGSDAPNALRMVFENEFPHVPIDRFITNTEIESLLTLSVEENGEELIQRWESLIIDQEKMFASLFQDYSYDYDKLPVYPLTELGKLIKRSPQYVDRIFYIISVMIENASYDNVWGAMPSFAFLRVFIDDIIDDISLPVLKALYKAVPNEKKYVLSLYQMCIEWKIEIKAKDTYDIYSRINRENHKEILSKSQFTEYGLIDIENLNYALYEYYLIKDLIAKRVNTAGNR